jgi:GH35 family endo-1,4-beta-xylanase
VQKNPAHGTDNFTLELYDSAGNSGKWAFNAPSTLAPMRLVSNATLANPESGVNNYQNLDLSHITSWNVLGQWQSPAPFDLSFDRIAVTNDVAPPPPYPGYEANAPWRAVAEQRIDAIRKAELQIEVTDATGVPLPGALVHAAMQKHEFGFDSAVTASLINPANVSSATYRSKIQQLFNTSVLENDLKWPAWIGEWGNGFNKPQTQAALNWLNSQGIRVRGHNLVWPGVDNLPQSLRTLLANPTLTPAEQQMLRDMIAAHISDIGGAVAGEVYEWDVINEPRANHDVMDALPEGNLAMVQWFQQARAADPNAELFLNEYDIVASGGATNTSSQQTYYDTLAYLKANGAPIDGLGMQGHFNAGSLTGPEQAWQIFDRFQALGLKMAITEFDFGTDDEALQAAYTRDFITAVFAHEGFDEFLMWGFWEGAHWRPNAALFRNDWSIKPNGQAYIDLVFNDWWTDQTLEAADDGLVELRGFKGDYLVTAKLDGASTVVTTNLTDGGRVLAVALPLLAADFNNSSAVDATDLGTWKANFGLVAGGSRRQGDANGDGLVDGADLLMWQRQNGSAVASAPSTALPEPASLVLVCFAAAMRPRRLRGCVERIDFLGGSL